MNVCVIVPAAGASSRFGASDKLAQDLGGRPLLIRAVENLAKHDAVRSIIVAGPPDPPEEFVAFKERYGPTLSFHGARVVEGGRDARWETVQKAIAEVPDDATHIAVHDAAHPGTGRDLLDRVFDAAIRFAAVIPVVDVDSTIKRVDADELDAAAPEDDGIADLILGEAGRPEATARRVLETIDRTNLVAVQTPQVFEADLLRRAYAQPDLSGATDDAMLVERLGETVHAVDGDPRNIKITTPADLDLMRAILQVKPPAERPVHKRF